MATVLTQQTATAAVPAALTTGTAQAALIAGTGNAAGTGVVLTAQASTLADATLKAMFWAKMKLYGLIMASVAVVAVPAYVVLRPANNPSLVGDDPSLVGHYGFAEGSGTTVNDASGSGNHGTLMAGVTWTAGPKPGSKALSFDGKTAYVKLDKDVARWLGATASVTCWIKTTQAGTDVTASQTPCIIGAEVWGDNDIVWGWLHTSGRIGVVAGGGTAAKPADGPTAHALSRQPINDGLWHHLAMTRDLATGEFRLSVDGAFQAAAISGQGTKTCSLTDIGRMIDHKETKHCFAGALHDVRFYSRVLNAQEIRVLAQP